MVKLCAMLLVKSVTKDLACELVISEEVVKPSQLVVADYVTQEVLADIAVRDEAGFARIVELAKG